MKKKNLERAIERLENQALANQLELEAARLVVHAADNYVDSVREGAKRASRISHGQDPGPVVPLLWTPLLDALKGYSVALRGKG